MGWEASVKHLQPQESRVLFHCDRQELPHPTACPAPSSCVPGELRRRGLEPKGLPGGSKQWLSQVLPAEEVQENPHAWGRGRPGRQGLELLRLVSAAQGPQELRHVVLGL